MQTKKIFLASSSELKDDRKGFDIFIKHTNKALKEQGVFLEPVIWKDFLDALNSGETKKQREAQANDESGLTQVGYPL